MIQATVFDSLFLVGRMTARSPGTIRYNPGDSPGTVVRLCTYSFLLCRLER